MNIEECIRHGAALVERDKPCHYHKNPEFVSCQRMLPEGLQPSLYYVLYPYLFAIAYGGDAIDQEFRIPSSQGQDSSRPIFIRRAAPPRRERIKNFVKTLLSPVLVVTRIKTQPYIEIDNKVYLFDLGTEGTLCPAAFRSLFPSLAYNHLKNKINASKSSWKICCPDHIKNLIFGSGEPDDTFFESICYWGKTARIEAKSPCRLHINSSSNSLEDITRALHFPCPALLNVLYGYYLTLVKGGELGFYVNSFDGALVQCPNPRSRVVVKIYRRQETIDFEILDIVGQACPRGILKGNKFSLPRDIAKNSFCLDAFNSLFLYCGLSEYSKESIPVRCVMKDCNASWRVSCTKSEQ